jgi:antirestriction protein ArdC
MNVYEIVTEEIVKSLEAGVVPWKKPWTGSNPTSWQTKKEYRGINFFILSASKYVNPYWFTFNQVKKLGGYVTGTGTPIVFWNFIEKEEVDENGKKVKKSTPFLRYYKVWNFEQVQGVDIKFEEKKLDFVPIEEAEKVISGYKNCPEIVSKEQRAYYAPKQDYINLPKKESFSSVEDYYSTAFHEIVHSTGHEKRLKRNLEGGFGSNSYGKEELVAELGAAFLNAKTGINSTIENNAAYIDNWIKAIKGDSKLVVTAAGAAQKAVDYIGENEVNEVNE